MEKQFKYMVVVFDDYYVHSYQVCPDADSALDYKDVLIGEFDSENDDGVSNFVVVAVTNNPEADPLFFTVTDDKGIQAIKNDYPYL